MDGENEKLSCRICGKEFSRVSAKNRHLRDIHNEKPKPDASKRTKHIKCPICPEEEKLGHEKHDMLINHLQQIHSLDIKTSLLTFKNEEEFETWRALDNRNVDYIKRSCRKSSDWVVFYYVCNRSNYSGFTSKCNQRSMKTGGTIKISGFCPSRIRVRISPTAVDVKFVETHVGHDNLPRSKRLTKDQQKMIASKLAAGITKERIMEELRTITNNKLGRINVLKKTDFAYIEKKFNIAKGKDDDRVNREAHLRAEDEPSNDDDDDDVSNNLYISLPSTSRAENEMDVHSVKSESSEISNAPNDSTTELSILLEQARSQLGLLNEGDIRNIAKMINEAYNLKYTNASTRKRKIEKQLDFPNKK